MKFGGTFGLSSLSAIQEFSLKVLDCARMLGKVIEKMINNDYESLEENVKHISKI